MPSALINGFDNADGLVEFGGELRLLARCPALRVNKAMRGRAVLLLLGLMTFGAYSVGRQSAPVSDAPVPAITSPSALAQPVGVIHRGWHRR
jgi:hypothetical protein